MATMNSAEKPLIQLSELRKSYGRVKAVDGVSLDIVHGEAVTIFGPNGAGKTTLLRMMAGLVRPSGGALTIDGEVVDGGNSRDVRSHIGYISHQALAYGQLTARENLVFFARLYGVVAPEARADVLLDEVGLNSRRDDLLQTFSRGMKQRLSIARALVHDPDIVLLDEPFTGLDQHAADMLMRTLSRLRKQRRTTVMITHNLTTGIAMGSRVMVQVAGNIRFDKPAESVDRATFADEYFSLVGEAHY